MEPKKFHNSGSVQTTISENVTRSESNNESKIFRHDKNVKIRAHRADAHPQIDLLPTSDSREERKANGRIIAVCAAIFLIFLGLYQAWIRRTAVVAGVIVPVLIMLLYTTWILYSAKRHKQKMLMDLRECYLLQYRQQTMKEYNRLGRECPTCIC
ncbi:uncharacterized protein LOC131692186 [Topomyia yanbarensis]|uniref:uncharacterized protein LOC131692186 n=1 Tax=Topomyia yanbarensis TaxID=2498891 RepID=UPI00273B6907|nr:uncharacterized protein LOC131692186 [Topomyia yanbarensis]